MPPARSDGAGQSKILAAGWPADKARCKSPASARGSYLSSHLISSAKIRKNYGWRHTIGPAYRLTACKFLSPIAEFAHQTMCQPADFEISNAPTTEATLLHLFMLPKLYICLNSCRLIELLSLWASFE